MENLLLSFQIIVPLFIYMLTGYWAKRRGFLSRELTDGINRLLFAILLPILLFHSIYRADLTTLSQPLLIPYALVATALNFLLIAGLFRRLEKNPAKRGSLIQGAFRGNAILYGMPIAISLFGEDDTAVVALVLAAVIPAYNVLAVLVLEICGQEARRAEGGCPLPDGSTGARIHWRDIALSIAGNPLIHGVLLGLVFNFSPIRLPVFLVQTLGQLSAVVTPMAFLLLGASFDLRSAGEDSRTIALASFLKLLVGPLLFLALPIHLGWKGPTLGAVLICFGAPTAVSSYPMAQAMGCDEELAGEIVVVTSAASLLSMFLWIFVLKQMMLL